jgi:ABC-type branched-subunit amino acid transport system ATPase component/ABC-type branched-subunit amino acid transport system permease subunit
MSFTVVTGLGGMVSLAQGAFATAAALTAGLLIHHGWPFVLAVLAGMAVAGVLGALTALPAMRLNGLMLTFATLALALLGTGVLFKIEWFTNGTLGWNIPRPRLGPVDLANDRVMLVVCFTIMLAVAWLVSNLQKSASGRAMIAVRTAEPAAAASAVSPPATKLLIFTISAVIAGLGGVLLVAVHGTILGTANPPQQSFLWLAVVVLLGLNRPSSAIEAGIVVALVPQVISNGFHIGGLGWNGTSDDLLLQILFGLGAITLANKPDGILAAQQKSARARRDKKRARKQAALSPAQQTTPAAAPATVIEVPHAQKEYGGTPVTGLLELHDVHAGYGEVEVLHGITLAIAGNTSLALLGANGSGKSTLCSVVAGLVPTASGRIIFNGEDITALSPTGRVERGIVLVPESRGVFPSVSVEENLTIWLPDKRERARAYDAFTPLAARKNQPAGNLSGGEQQMLSLAPFLVRNPRLLIADEPSLGLARIITTQIMDALRLLQSEGTTILLVEEKARDILTVADHVGALQRGTLQWIAERGDVDEQLVTAAYLGLSTVA